ncbi:MAG: hypothetical protein HOO96_02165 [Polyangiaceae bacterium]|nr:hypothetical protein [Polyangiaceae bacterium]
MATPKEECEELMSAVMPHAEELLAKHGEFFPFGATLSPSNEVILAAAHTGQEQPPSLDVIRLLEEGFRQGAAQARYKATALVYDVRVVPPKKAEKQDAIAVRLDHRDRYAVVVYFPYVLTPSGEPALDAPFATAVDAPIFAST